MTCRRKLQLTILLYYIMLLYFILLYYILLFPLCWCCKTLILLIVFGSMYGYITLDVSRHMFGWLEGTEYQVSTSQTYCIRLCEVQQFLYAKSVFNTYDNIKLSNLTSNTDQYCQNIFFGIKFLHYIRHKLPHTTATS